MSKFSTWFCRTLFVAVDKIFYKSQNPKNMLSADGLVRETDICYDDSKYPDDCLLDTYFIKTNEDKKLPVFIYIHGGGFVAGDKAYRYAHSVWVAKMGYFVVNINHSLAPKAQFPEPIQQLAKAINWVEQNAEKYNLDLNNVVISGDSAGGYFSAEMVACSLSKELQADLGLSFDVKFNAAVYNCGIYDLEAIFQNKILFDLGNKLLLDLAGITKDQLTEYKYYKQCAPINYITEEYPLAFITHAQQDFFCGGQAPSLIKQLSARGLYYEEFGSDKFSDNHCFSLTWSTPAAINNNQATEKFLRRVASGELARKTPVAAE